jgi:dihydroxyacetone kinase
MAIRVLAQRNSLAAQYATAAPNGCVFTADPGTGGNATGEVSGGSPAYARKAIGGNWATATASASAVTGTATFDIPASTTVTYAGVAVSATATTNDVRDSVAVTSQTFASQGTYAVTYTFTQS